VQRLIRVFEDFIYGFDSGVDVPMEAAHALVRGLDGPALVDLAGLGTDQRLEVRDLIPMVSAELGMVVPPREAVVAGRISEVAAQYLDGEIKFLDALPWTLWWFGKYFEEGSGYRCCDEMLWLQLWYEDLDFDGNTTFGFGSAEAAEKAFRRHTASTVDGGECPAPVRA
jgi:hypothetical protein